MSSPDLTDQLTAWAAVATAAFTLLLALMALAAWRTAKATLEASASASVAAQASADAARLANQQMQEDSIAQTRPYVFVEIVPGLASMHSWDIKITNSGRSSARDLTLQYDQWPTGPDDVGESLRALFDTPRTLPPACSIRAIWRLQAAGAFEDGTTEAGLGTTGTIEVAYASDDARPYQDSFQVQIDKAGLWPVPEQGPNGDGLSGDTKKFYRLGQTLVRRLGELSR